MEANVNKVTAIRSYAKRLKLSWLSVNATELLVKAGKEDTVPKNVSE